MHPRLPLHLRILRHHRDVRPRHALQADPAGHPGDRGLAGAGAGKVFFADDNFIGNRAYAKELLRAVGQWNGRQRCPLGFYTQASIDMVRDEELLGLLRDANFFAVFLGIETPRKASLAEASKTQNVKLDLVKAVHKIQSYNLFVSAGMIVGFDHDDPSIFEEQYEFLQEAQIPIVLVNALEAVPRTPLYIRLKAEGRLLNGHPDAEDTTRYESGVGKTNFRLKLMSGGELKEGLERLFQKLYAPEAFAARLLGNLSRFKNVTFRPERLQASYLLVFWRLIRYYWSQGWVARKILLGLPVAGPAASPRGSSARWSSTWGCTFISWRSIGGPCPGIPGPRPRTNRGRSTRTAPQQSGLLQRTACTRSRRTGPGMTSKGLEFEHVYVIRMNESKMPSHQSTQKGGVIQSSWTFPSAPNLCRTTRTGRPDFLQPLLGHEITDVLSTPNRIDRCTDRLGRVCVRTGSCPKTTHARAEGKIEGA